MDTIGHRILGIFSLLLLISLGVGMIWISEQDLELRECREEDFPTQTEHIECLEQKERDMAEFRVLLSSKGGKILTGSIAVLLWVYFINPFVMAWFQIREIYDRSGKWKDVQPVERAAWISGWFVTMAAWIVGFMFGGTV